jgi:DNA-directed RNA polymerase subunit D
LDRVPKVSIVELDDRRIKLIVEGFPVAFVNSIRRCVLSDVPTMAVDFAYFYDNTSSAYDEIIAHRLGLVVLKSDEALKKYKSPEECRDAPETDRSCFAEIIIKKEVDENSDKGEYVKASDMEISDPSIKPAYPETPITYLAPGQRVYIVAYARLGRGREHGKWSPASVSILKYTPVLKVLNRSNISDECLKCLEAYPEVISFLKEGKDDVLELINVERTSGLRYCAETVCKESLKLIYSKEKLILEVESTGALKPERIIYEALNALETRVLTLKKAIGGE